MNGNRLRSAIVTGASGGIGRNAALRLARDGFAVSVHYAGNEARAAEIANEIEANGGRAIAVRADISVASDVEALFDATTRAFGGVDVVVNAAAIMTNAPIAQFALDTFDEIVATNLRGTFLVLHHSANRIAKGGRIIAFSSSVVAVSLPGYGPYIASKLAVEGLVRVLANELRGRNVTVNAIAPGPVATELFLRGKSDELVEKLSKAPPLERLGQPEDIEGVVSFLAGPDGAWVNGQVLRANGGFA
ncbi:MAG: SDR family oxidoreductase [Phycisphaerales bacterium]|nr:SDR family oxidoreductase [Phycisphaerales bacterium]MCB9864955.1 SDR family oxidoreductase [Phycisphaerales bacterium]